MKNLNKINAHSYERIAYILFALFYFWLASQIPYTHDDWDWGLSIGLQQLITANLNSRYAGNFLEVVMTRSALLKMLILGTGYFLIPFTVSTIVINENKKKHTSHKVTYFVLCNILLLLMKRNVWQQTYGWVAGFANFVISALFLLVVIKEGLRVFDEIDSKSNHFSVKCPTLLIVGVISQLFLENIAIFLFLYSLVINFIYYKRTGSISKEYIFLTLGALIGLTILFSSNIYQQLWNTGNAVGGYRHIHVNANTSIGDFVYSSVLQVVYLLCAMLKSNLLAYSCVLLLINAVFLLKMKKQKTWSIACISVNICLLVFFALYYFFGFMSNALFLSVVNAFYILMVTGELILLFMDAKPFLGKLLSIWISVFAVIAPLALTSETGPRLFFTTHVLLILVAIMLLSSIIDLIPKKIYWYGVIFSVVAAIVLVVFLGKVYFEIGMSMDQRNKIIAQAVENGADEIILPNYPHLDYLWFPNPADALRVEFFKEFYGIPQDVTVFFEK